VTSAYAAHSVALVTLNDLTPEPDDGWSELMALATSFPLETLSFGGPQAPAVITLPKARTVSYDDVIDIAHGAGLSLATW
jgi:hypothetical protein